MKPLACGETPDIPPDAGRWMLDDRPRDGITSGNIGRDVTPLPVRFLEKQREVRYGAAFRKFSPAQARDDLLDIPSAHVDVPGDDRQTLHNGGRRAFFR